MANPSIDTISKTETDRILGEYRVSQAESLENDYGPDVAFHIIAYRAREAQFKALSKEFREMANRAEKMAQILDGLCQSDS